MHFDTISKNTCSLKFYTRWSPFLVSWEAISPSAPYGHAMTEKYLQGRIGARRTADREICRQLRPAKCQFCIQQFNFFSAHFARRLSAPALLNLFHRLCLPLLFKQKSCSTKIAKINSILQIYVQEALTRSQASGSEGPWSCSKYSGKLPSLLLPQAKESPYAYKLIKIIMPENFYYYIATDMHGQYYIFAILDYDPYFNHILTIDCAEITGSTPDNLHIKFAA